MRARIAALIATALAAPVPSTPAYAADTVQPSAVVGPASGTSK